MIAHLLFQLLYTCDWHHRSGNFPEELTCCIVNNLFFPLEISIHEVYRSSSKGKVNILTAMVLNKHLARPEIRSPDLPVLSLQGFHPFDHRVCIFKPENEERDLYNTKYDRDHVFILLLVHLQLSIIYI